jgi:uncharacterized protein (DUF433 family)
MILPDFLTRDADGDIRLAGHRIGLYTVIRLYREGRTAEQIAQELPSLPLALMHQVLAFYRENKAEVDAYVDAYQAELDRQEAAYVPGPGILRLRHLKKLVQEADERYGSDPTWSSLTIIEKLQRLGALPPTNPV